MRLLKKYLYLFLILPTLLVKGIDVQNIPFEPLDINVGLSIVKDIYRDSEDYLWLANDGFGLMRYDTYQLKSFIHDESDSTSLCNDYVLKNI